MMSDPKPTIDESRARELLQRERERIEGSLAQLQRTRASELDEVDTSTDPEDEGAVIAETEVDDALVQQLRRELDAIGRAEQRLADGTYGLSIESGDPIAAGRLEAVPWAERTPEEQERLEGS